MKKTLILFLALMATSFVFSQNKKGGKKGPQENWFNLDPTADKAPGISTEKAYEELLKGKKPDTILVAVIDGGTDIFHEDLKEVIWTNPNEIAGNGIDDDRNGYVDDMHGWNYLGGKDSSVNYETLELTRQLKKYQTQFAGKDTTKLTPEEEQMRVKYREIEKQYQTERLEYCAIYDEYNAILKVMDEMRLKSGKKNPPLSMVEAWVPATKSQKGIKKVLVMLCKKNEENFSLLYQSVGNAVKSLEKYPKYMFNTDFNPRVIVGDNPDDLSNRLYGNADVKGPEAGHGTHVAGIIGAVRTNPYGMAGVCGPVKIMVLRVVPDGDERDKDVANAIRYAADHGAKVLNMSFGKSMSPQKTYVDEAIKYAASKGVLLVHAAGNDNKNIDVEPNFPNAISEKGDTCASWIEVGASNYEFGKELPANFSNYGKKKVDLFAPGVQVYSTIPENKYASFNGTSMASPVVAGAACLVWSYYPNLTAAQVKYILLASARPVKNKVKIPGSKKKVKFTELCKTGAILNVYDALKLAESMNK